MKKIIALVLIFTMLMSLTACSADQLREGVEGVVQDAVENKAEQMNEKLGRSKIDGNVLTSEATDITFVKPASWVFADDEQIKELAGTGADVFDQSEFAEAISKAKTVYDAVAMDPVSGSNIIFMYENLAIGNNEGISIEKYVEAMKDTLKQQSAMTVEMGELSEVTLSGKTYHRVIANSTSSGVQFTQIYYLRKIDGYMHAVICSLTDGSDAAKVEAMFSDAALQADKEGGVLPFARGKYEGNIYKSDFAGLTFEKPDDWDYMSSSELANEMGLSGNALTDENVAATYTEEGYIYDMYALSPDGGNVIFYLENALGGDEQDYIESIKLELQADEEVTYSDVEVGTRTLGGAQYRSVATRGEYEGMKICQTYYLKVVDGVMCAAIITALDETELADTEACFK